MIYMDNAATTLQKPREVAESVFRAICTMGNAGRSSSEASLTAARMIYEAREKIASFFGAENAKCIAFTANSTQSLNTAIKGTLHSGDHVITTVLEHNSVLRPLFELKETGVELTIVGCDGKGNISYAEVRNAVQKNTKAIVCTHASNLTGNMIDVERMGGIARENGLLLIVDASQTAGIYPIDVRAAGIDILCFTGHKSMLGPQGTGGLYVREGVKVEPLITGGSGIDTYNVRHPDSMPTALEAGTLNGHGIAGLCAAVTYLEQTGIDTVREIELGLMRQFYEEVSHIPEVKIYGDFEVECRCPIVALNIRDYDSSEVSDELSCTYGIATRPGAHCAPLMHGALGTRRQGAVRFSFSHFNTEEEIRTAIEAVRKIAES